MTGGRTGSCTGRRATARAAGIGAEERFGVGEEDTERPERMEVEHSFLLLPEMKAWDFGTAFDLLKECKESLQVQR